MNFFKEWKRQTEKGRYALYLHPLRLRDYIKTLIPSLRAVRQALVDERLTAQQAHLDSIHAQAEREKKLDILIERMEQQDKKEEERRQWREAAQRVGSIEWWNTYIDVPGRKGVTRLHLAQEMCTHPLGFKEEFNGAMQLGDACVRDRCPICERTGSWKGVYSSHAWQAEPGPRPPGVGPFETEEEIAAKEQVNPAQKYQNYREAITRELKKDGIQYLEKSNCNDPDKYALLSDFTNADLKNK